MKRTALVLFLAAVLLLMSACGLQKTSEVPAAQEAEGQQAAVVEPEPTPEPTQEPTPEPTPEPLQLPEVDLKSKELLLANSYNSIGVDYMPMESSFLEGQTVDTLIFEPASEFVRAARDAGFSCFFSVAYRNTDYVNSVYRRALANCDNDPVKASSMALASGLSDHQTALAVDFTDSLEYSCCYTEFWDDYMRDTELYQWLVEHCADYGFILRYPEGKEEFYGIACQHPAHFRYVGKEVAHFIMDNGLCLEEFLMLYEGNDVYLPEAGVGLRVNERG